MKQCFFSVQYDDIKYRLKQQDAHGFFLFKSRSFTRNAFLISVAMMSLVLQKRNWAHSYPSNNFGFITALWTKAQYDVRLPRPTIDFSLLDSTPMDRKAILRLISFNVEIMIVL